MAPVPTTLISPAAFPHAIPILESRSTLSPHSLIPRLANQLFKRDGLPRNDVIAIIIICLFAVLAVTAWVIVATRHRLMMFGRGRRVEVEED